MFQRKLPFNNKNIGPLFLFSVLFVFLILPHTTILDRPLFGLHDLVNGEHLTIVSLWKSEGIVTHHFIPILSFEPHDILSRNTGLIGTNHRIYYASYPPLSFWIDYFVSSLPFMPASEVVARISSLLTFTITIGFLFFYLYRRYSLSAAAIGTSVFSLVPASMYYFGGITAPEITRFMFWIPAFVFIDRWYQRPSLPILFLYGCSIFLLSLTDWIGVILTGSIGLYTIIYCIRFWRNKKKIIHTAVIGTVTIFSSAIAIVGTIALYSSIATIQSVIDLWVGKGSYRGNWFLLLHDLSTEVNGTASMSGGFFIWIQRVLHGYLFTEFGVIFWILILAMIIIVLFISTRKKNEQYLFDTKNSILIIIFFFIPPSILALLLPQAHYVHDFYWLSFLPFLSLLAAILYCTIEKHLIAHIKHASYLLLCIPIGLIATLYVQSLSTFYVLRDGYTGDETTLKTFRLLREVSTVTNSHDVVLMPYPYQPNSWFYLRRNAFQFVTLPDHIEYLRPQFNYFKNVYYIGDDRQMVTTMCGSQQVTSLQSGFICTLQ